MNGTTRRITLVLAAALPLGLGAAACGASFPSEGVEGRQKNPVREPCADLGEAECLRFEACVPVYAPAPIACFCDEADGCTPCPRPVFVRCEDAVPAPACDELLCDVHCDHGHVLDADGCPTCACNPPPSGCSDIRCQLWCEYGFVIGEAGCPICECNPPPAPCRVDADCPEGSTCLLPDCGPEADCGDDAGVCVAPEVPACGDGTVRSCRMQRPICPGGQLLTVRNGCWDCVDPASCVSCAGSRLDEREICRGPAGALPDACCVGACIDVIAYAADPDTGACLEFPTPCDVPYGWRECQP